MTIERPMFPPRAESVHAFPPQPAVGQPGGESLTSESSKPAEGLPSATVIELRSRAINPPVQRAEYEGLSPWKARSKREESSSIIKTAVSYVCNKSTAEPGYIADHTGDGVFAGYGGIVGEKYLNAADRSLCKLIKLTEKAKNPLTVELWSLASVAGFVIKLGTEPGAELQDDEIAFLKSFAGLVERVCKDQYHRETEVVRS
jgi:hypothetical protein